MMNELELVKHELSALKLEIPTASEEKSRVKEATATSSLKMCALQASLEALRKELEETTEEQVLLELARIEALKEFRSIEAQRRNEAIDFSSAMERMEERRKDLIQEAGCVKEIEAELAARMSDIFMLQNELKQVVSPSSKLKPLAENGLDLVAVAELGSARNHLSSVREEGFRTMASMDVVRNELNKVREEAVRLKEVKERKDASVRNLDFKLLHAKSKLESASIAEEKARSVVTNLSETLQQLQTKAESAKNEEVVISKETAAIREEIWETEAGIDLNEERLESVMHELEALKSSEETALENLRILKERTARERAFAAENSSSITISNFEYEYLMGCGGEAERVADKKVAAAQAWVEALKASEGETMMTVAMVQKEMVEMSNKGIEEGAKSENNSKGSQQNLQAASPRKSMKQNGNSTPARRTRFRNSASSTTARYAVKKGRMVVPNLVKFFINKRMQEMLSQSQ